jgi:hypothetical protein
VDLAFKVPFMAPRGLHVLSLVLTPFIRFKLKVYNLIKTMTKCHAITWWLSNAWLIKPLNTHKTMVLHYLWLEICIYFSYWEKGSFDNGVSSVPWIVWFREQNPMMGQRNRWQGNFCCCYTRRKLEERLLNEQKSLLWWI